MRLAPRKVCWLLLLAVLLLAGLDSAAGLDGAAAEPETLNLEDDVAETPAPPAVDADADAADADTEPPPEEEGAPPEPEVDEHTDAEEEAADTRSAETVAAEAAEATAAADVPQAETSRAEAAEKEAYKDMQTEAEAQQKTEQASASQKAADSAKAEELARLARYGRDMLLGEGGQRKQVSEGLRALRSAAESGSATAEYVLGEFYECVGQQHDSRMALKWYTSAAARGFPAAQSALARMYQIGLGVDRDEAKAVMYHYFAASGGDARSQVTLGASHMLGLGVPKSCDTAFSYYTPVAEKVISEAQRPQGPFSLKRVRLSDTSAEESGRAHRDEELVEYYEFAASKGDHHAQFAMGQLYYQGLHALPVNFEAAHRWFLQAAEGGDARAMSMLGHMSETGIHVAQNNKTALGWYHKANNKGYAGASTGLGIMHMQGMGVKKNYTTALKFFTEASEKGNAEAHYNLGAMYIDGVGVVQDNSKALQHFAVAAGEGHLLALYNLAVMHHNGLGTSRSCDLAVQYLKNVVERGGWMGVMANASKHFDNDEFDRALRLYMLAADQGVEMAQSNAAFILDSGLALGVGKGRRERAKLALHYYTLSAQLGNAESLLKLGDYAYYGRGADIDFEEAAAYYMQSSELKNAHSYFNLGFMHQFGLGLPQDFHLAKRFYDMTLQTSNSDAAYYPVSIALGSLRMTIWWTDSQDSLPRAVTGPVRAAAKWVWQSVQSLSQLGDVDAAAAGGGGAAAASDGDSSSSSGSASEESEGRGDAAASTEMSWTSFVQGAMSSWHSGVEMLPSLNVSALKQADADTMAITALCLVLAVLVWRRGMA